eukprot:gene4556-14736_t
MRMPSHFWQAEYISDTWQNALVSHLLFFQLHIFQLLVFCSCKLSASQVDGEVPFTASAEPLQGMRVLDVGCDGGLLSESMARMGAQVRGIDITIENVMAARQHAAADPGISSRSSCYEDRNVSARPTPDKENLPVEKRVKVEDPEVVEDPKVVTAKKAEEGRLKAKQERMAKDAVGSKKISAFFGKAAAKKA